ncbi:MAG: hypothetical protein COV10_01105 [Candidatus Vogelbacteria bacterium CG10_big_fil_rev_8_21_14_0_10_51_16]|uniref:Trigger factor n=1 Tax=Candidatus Vogelbacteria bacterium CG10_big_fil_rev_8_21_14_0_10_51_16 TaxID=1975045 RepID=A0A2H0RFF7_9BACT|nr:MAG: hypothetical protein COV10_01105 [Candidatus Vogelbacteria bacterium CG10_big_fil_rev_8_21_14_0_10_51_16]
MPLPKTTLEKIAGSRIKITGEIDAATFTKYRPKALKQLNETVKLDGFRPGHIPESVLCERVGEMAILEEMANEALGDAYPQIVEAHSLDVVGRPEVQITKVAKDNPLGFVLTVSVLPEVSLGEYKELAREGKKKGEAMSLEVSEKEIESALKELQAMQTAKEEESERNKPDSAEAEKKKTVAKDEEGQKNLPAIDDAFAQSLGQFKDLADLKAKLRENMTQEKKQARAQAVRHGIIEALVSAVAVDIPEVLIENELERMLAETYAEAKRYGIEKEAYLKASKTSEEKLRVEWKENARKRVTAELALREVGIKEKVSVLGEELEAEVAKLLALYPEANKDGASRYLAEQMTKEAVLKKLESF